MPHSAPQRITVPSVKVDAPLTEVGLDADGWVEPPPLEDSNLAGWYRGSVTPGERGASVIVGHVDNTAGPAVFYELGALERGSRIEIPREDGRKAVFAVYDVEVFAKKEFPAARVYADGPEPELRPSPAAATMRGRPGTTGTSWSSPAWSSSADGSPAAPCRQPRPCRRPVGRM